MGLSGINTLGFAAKGLMDEQARQRQLSTQEAGLGLQQQGLDLQKQEQQFRQQDVEAQRRQQQVKTAVEGLSQAAQRAKTPQQKQAVAQLAETLLEAYTGEQFQLDGTAENNAILIQNALKTPTLEEQARQSGTLRGIEETSFRQQLPAPAPKLLEIEKLQRARDQAISAGRHSDAVEIQNIIEKQGAESKGQTINVNTAGSSFLKEGGKKRAEGLFQARDAAIDAQKTLSSAKEARNIVDQGIITGTAADFRVNLGKALQLSGFNFAEDEIANTEAFVAQRAGEVGRIIKQFGAGTGLSDADREFATKAAAGSIKMTEPSIRKILDIQERVARNLIKNYNADLRSIPNEARDALFLNPIEINEDIIQQPLQDGQTATNPQTGEKLILRNGQWQPL